MARSIGKDEKDFFRGITHRKYDDYHGPYTTIGAAKAQARNIRTTWDSNSYPATVEKLVPLINENDELELGWKPVAKYDGTSWTNI